MSGYRESSFDPYATQRYGRPLRPYNWVQWAGVALILCGLAVDLLYFGHRLGWTAQLIDSPALALPPIVLGGMLIGSRREPPTGEVRTTSRRTLMLIAVALVAFALGLTAILYFKGV